MFFFFTAVSASNTRNSLLQCDETDANKKKEEKCVIFIPLGVSIYVDTYVRRNLQKIFMNSGRQIE